MADVDGDRRDFNTRGPETPWCWTKKSAKCADPVPRIPRGRIVLPEGELKRFHLPPAAQESVAVGARRRGLRGWQVLVGFAWVAVSLLCAAIGESHLSEDALADAPPGKAVAEAQAESVANGRLAILGGSPRPDRLASPRAPDSPISSRPSGAPDGRHRKPAAPASLRRLQLAAVPVHGGGYAPEPSDNLQDRAERSAADRAFEADFESRSALTPSSSARPIRKTTSDAPSTPSTSTSSTASCEAAYERAQRLIDFDRGASADVPRRAYARALENLAHYDACTIPDEVNLRICVAVVAGRATGVTVTTRPNQPEVARCVAQAVRRLRFPHSGNPDLVRTEISSAR